MMMTMIMEVMVIIGYCCCVGGHKVQLVIAACVVAVVSAQFGFMRSKELCIIPSAEQIDGNYFNQHLIDDCAGNFDFILLGLHSSLGCKHSRWQVNVGRQLPFCTAFFRWGGVGEGGARNALVICQLPFNFIN